MSTAQHGSISSHSYHQIHIIQMLPVQFHSVDAAKIDFVTTKQRQQIIDALFVGLVPFFQSLPPQGFGGLAS